MALQKTDLMAEQEKLRRQYRLDLQQIIDQATSELAADKVSNHFGFNLGCKASELQGLAYRIEQLRDFIHWADFK